MYMIKINITKLVANVILYLQRTNCITYLELLLDYFVLRTVFRTKIYQF